MGSVTIHLLVEMSLKGGNSGLLIAGDDNADDFQFESLSHILPADSSLAELMDVVVLKLLNNDDTTTLSKKDKLQQLTILDLSYNPVKIISDICRANTDLTGPKSKTLQSMNWYPSGKICFLPLPSTTITSSTTSITDIEKGDELMLQKFLTWQSRNVVKDEDFAYNDPNIIQNQHHNNPEKKKDDGAVQWTGVGADSTAATQQRLKPSEIFTAVSTRSDNDDDHEDIQQHSKKPPAKKKRSEKQRSQRLDTLIQKLAAKSSSSKDDGGKKKRVSDKVRTMLIKSRAEGNKKLRMEDRFHLELLQIIDNGEENDDDIKCSDEAATTSYKFFSRVTTAGRAASSVAGSIGNRKSVEFLVAFPPVSTKDDTTNIKYRRLPNTMSLHDAQQAGWLQEFDVVVIRIFSIDRDDEFGQSKSVLDSESDVDSENNNEVDDDVVMQSEFPSESSCASMNKDTSSMKDDEQDDDNRLQQRLHLIYQTASFDDKQKSTKKKKPVSKQVQAMLMKSKSTGNKSIKPNDRVHFDTVIFRDDGSEDIEGSCSSSFRFFSRRMSIDELIATFQNEKDLPNNVEIITSQSCSSSSLGCIYKKLTPSQATIEETVKLGLLEDFGRIIVRLTLSDCKGKLPSA